MASRVQPINLLNFTGGVNLRADAFELGEGESPDMLNVDIDPRGGFVSRKGWSKVNAAPIGGVWDPRALFVHELADGSDNLYLYSDALYKSLDGGATWTSTTLVGDADPHGMDFGNWGDFLYVVRGPGFDARRIDQAGVVTSLTHAQAATWSPYTAPVAAFPRASNVASHQGYIFVGDTYEDNVRHPYRIRWSHPNNPAAWASLDFTDIKEGGGPITGIVPNRDHVLIFQKSAVWALFGYNSDNWNLVNVSREVGALHRQVIARSESAVFFYSHPHGVFAIQGDSMPAEMSQALRPALESPSFNKLASDNMWLGWVDQQLWFSLPYWKEGTALTARTTFVWDPTLSQGGSWKAYRSADGYGIGPLAQGGRGGGGDEQLAASPVTDSVLNLDGNLQPIDDIDGTPTAVAGHYVTGWMDAGMPTLKKQWRRPDIVAKERSADYDLTVDCFRDYDEVSIERTKIVRVDAGGTGSLWGDFEYGDGTVYGPAAVGSRIERAGNLGPARAVQLRIAGTPGLRWGVDAIIFKYIPRRLR